MKRSTALWLAVPIALAAAAFALSQTTPPPVAERVGRPAGGTIEKADAEWRAALTPEQYRITRDRGTERACTGAFWDTHEPGRYDCVCCGQILFDSDAKFDSGTGWPSFTGPADDEALSIFTDRDLWMVRSEVRCSRCDAHLGHVFTDGPGPGGLRYCINSGALKHVPRK
jgi:peptide-methionine (R)-S-oxide reductase